MTAITPRHLKYISLLLLALQNAALIIVMRYVRTRPGDMFASTTAVVMNEILKVITCFVVIWFEEGMSIRGCGRHLNENIIQQPWDCVRVSVPAFIYMIQNNLIYVAASNLDVATFQVKTVSLRGPYSSIGGVLMITSLSIGGNTTNVCATLPIRHQSYVAFSLCCYQSILLGNRDTCI